MKARVLDISGIEVKVVTQDNVELACDLFGMQSEVVPISALLHHAVDQDIDEYGGGVVCYQLDDVQGNLWKGLRCGNEQQINRMLVERLGDEPEDIIRLMANCEEPWVEWSQAGRTYFALLIDAVGNKRARYYWAVVCFEGHEWVRKPT